LIESEPISRSGEPAVEATCLPNWISQALSEKKRERLAEKASRAPDLAVILAYRFTVVS
jgi:hypothetical protein